MGSLNFQSSAQVLVGYNHVDIFKLPDGAVTGQAIFKDVLYLINRGNLVKLSYLLNSLNIEPPNTNAT